MSGPSTIECSPSQPPSKKFKDGEVLFSSAEEKECDWKIFRDPVHGSIKLHPVLVSVIDTPQFQRLRDVKQLGASYWVFPGASHNRFEHCIGTSFLCGEMIRSLQQMHPDLVSQTDVLCIEIAGLCHDLGHGPFSHVFDNVYMKLMEPESRWTHEQASIEMFDYMVDENVSVQKSFEKFKIGGNEMQLIKDLIIGKNPNADSIQQRCMYKGKEYAKWFLYEIVANKRNGIDCDKFDYLMRDSHFVGTHSNFDCRRYFQHIKIILVDQQLQICARDKEKFNLYELFHTRWSLHHKVYQHKTTKIIEQMLIEALSKVDMKFGISASIRDMSMYMNLSDSIIYVILKSTEESKDVKEAKAILRRIQKRDLYKYCGQVNAELIRQEADLPSTQDVLNRGPSGIAEDIAALGSFINADDVFVSIINISFGMREADPIDNVIFFTKDNKPIFIKKEEISEMLPQKFSEKYIRVYCRNAAKKSLVEEAFSAWCIENGFQRPQFLESDSAGNFTSVHKDHTNELEMLKNRFDSIKKNPNVRKKIEY
eukprot:gene18294-20117_t